MATGQQTGHAAARRPYQSGELQGDERILHALNRFTFGPRPGDLEAVRAMGLEKWFVQQLHPENIDNSDLDARLAQFPAMQESTPDLLFRLPSGAVIRQAANGKAPVPQGGALHAVYMNEMDRYEERQQQKQLEKQLVAMAPANSGMTGQTVGNDGEKMTPEDTPAMQGQAEAGQMMAPAAGNRSEHPHRAMPRSRIFFRSRQRSAWHAWQLCNSRSSMHFARRSRGRSTTTSTQA